MTEEKGKTLDRCASKIQFIADKNMELKRILRAAVAYKGDIGEYMDEMFSTHMDILGEDEYVPEYYSTNTYFDKDICSKCRNYRTVITHGEERHSIDSHCIDCYGEREFTVKFFETKGEIDE